MDEINYFVYIHEFPNGKVYIGQTRKSPDTRWYSDGCVGRQISSGGYGWQFVDEPHPYKGNWSSMRSVYQIDLVTGIIIKEFPTMRLAVDEIGVSQDTIKKCCDGKRRSAKGFAWQYTDEPHPYVNPKPLKKVVQLDKETDEFISVYDSVFDVEEKTGISHKGVSRCCGGFGNSYKGYKWMWLDNYGGDTYA